MRSNLDWSQFLMCWIGTPLDDKKTATVVRQTVVVRWGRHCRKWFLRLFRGGRTDGRMEDGGRTVLARCCELLPCLRRRKEMRRKEGRNVLAGGNFDHLRKEEGSRREIATLQWLRRKKDFFISLAWMAAFQKLWVVKTYTRGHKLAGFE